MSKGSKSRIKNKRAFDINHDEINWNSKKNNTPKKLKKDKNK